MSDAAAVEAFQRAVAERRAPEAVTLFDALPDALRAHPALRAQAAGLAGEMGDRLREAEMLTQLLGEFPHAVDVQLALAYALRTLGRREQAEALLREAIAMAPTLGAPWRLLAEMSPGSIDAQDQETMRAMLGGASEHDAVALHFALSWAAEHANDVDAVAEHVLAGNAIAARLHPEPPRGGTTIAERSRELVDADLLAQRSTDGHPSDAPIFILGLPRSGSTLVEQILAAHPAVEATLELPVLPQILREHAAAAGLTGAGIVDHLAALPAAELQAVAQAYLDRVAGYRRTDRPHFTDKLPGNWANVALIRLLFPKARIIDTRRHPMATGWSIFRHHFPGGPAFAHRQASIGARIRAYLAMMEHMDAVAPGTVHRMIHEELVQNPEAHIRAMLDRLGLAFDPACLAFHAQDRAVSTASTDQVRRPVDAARATRWQAYEPWLGELGDALGDALDRWRGTTLVAPTPLA